MKITEYSPLRIAVLVATGIIALALLILSGMLIEVLDAGHTMVIQYPTGTLRVCTDPGIYAQWFGSVTRYPKREQLWFVKEKDADRSLPITFNDGGRGWLSGSLAWEMPHDPKNIIALHIRYRSPEAIQAQLVRMVTEKTATFTGPLMSSTESYAARKGDLLFFVEDQLLHGVYKTESQQVRAKDTMTGIERTVTQVTILRGSNGQALRQDASPLDEFGVRIFNLAIKDIFYDPAIVTQISDQQKAFAQVATAIARAKEAEQDAITAEKQGQANAAKAKWLQEVIKATEVTKAEQDKAVEITQAQKRRDVATLEAEAAAQTKRQQVLLGEGEAQRRQLVMQADGALALKLETYKEVQGLWAAAFKDFKGQVVPQVVTGGAGAQSNAALNFMELIGIKAARDLAVETGAKR